MTIKDQTNYQISTHTEPTILDIIHWNFSAFQQSFHPPYVKWFLTASITNIVQVLMNELPNGLTSLEVRKYYQNSKIGWVSSLVPSILGKNNTLVATKNYEEAIIQSFLSKFV